MGLASKIGKEIAHHLIGFLVEQQWLDDHISWYDSEKGTFSNSVIEFSAGITYTMLGYGPEGLLLSMDAANRKTKKGSYALEIPWAIGKGVYNLPKINDIDLDNIDLDSPWG